MHLNIYRADVFKTNWLQLIPSHRLWPTLLAWASQCEQTSAWDTRGAAICCFSPQTPTKKYRLKYIYVCIYMQIPKRVATWSPRCKQDPSRTWHILRWQRQTADRKKTFKKRNNRKVSAHCCTTVPPLEEVTLNRTIPPPLRERAHGRVHVSVLDWRDTSGLLCGWRHCRFDAASPFLSGGPAWLPAWTLCSQRAALRGECLTPAGVPLPVQTDKSKQSAASARLFAPLPPLSSTSDSRESTTLLSESILVY